MFDFQSIRVLSNFFFKQNHIVQVEIYLVMDWKFFLPLLIPLLINHFHCSALHFVVHDYYGRGNSEYFENFTIFVAKNGNDPIVNAKFNQKVRIQKGFVSTIEKYGVYMF